MEKRFGANEDRISKLPIELIHVILSFMDTKYVVQTSVLSKRWEPIWKSHPCLKFESRLFHKKDTFMKFVRYVISSRDNNAGISSITCVSNSSCIPLTQRIIRYAISHNSKYLNISGCSWPLKNWVSYSPLIFSSPHLKKLSLSVNVEILDSSLNFPSSESLDVQFVHFKFLSGEKSNKSANPFSRLLSLRELTLTYCYYTGVEVIDIESIALLKLNISTRVHEETKFTVSTPNLSSFAYKGHFPLLLQANDLHCLEHVDIHVPDYSASITNHFDRRFVRDMINLFRQLTSTVTLTLSFDILMLLNSDPEVIEHEPSPFFNLKCLKLVRRPYSDLKICNDAVIFLLNRSERATVLIQNE